LDIRTWEFLFLPLSPRFPRLSPGLQKADASFWSSIEEVHAATAADYKQLIEIATRKIAAAEEAQKHASDNAAAAKDRVERIERGEDVQGGLGKPMRREDFIKLLRQWGWTTADIKHLQVTAAIGERGDDVFARYVEHILLGQEKVKHRAARDFLKAVRRAEEG
jgi:hypothetical protein